MCEPFRDLPEMKKGSRHSIRHVFQLKVKVFNVHVEKEHLTEMRFQPELFFTGCRYCDGPVKLAETVWSQKYF